MKNILLRSGELRHKNGCHKRWEASKKWINLVLHSWKFNDCSRNHITILLTWTRASFVETLEWNQRLCSTVFSPTLMIVFTRIFIINPNRNLHSCIWQPLAFSNYGDRPLTFQFEASFLSAGVKIIHRLPIHKVPQWLFKILSVRITKRYAIQRAVVLSQLPRPPKD